MIFNSEALELVGFLVLYDRKTFETTDAVVKTGSWCLDFNRAVWYYFRGVPSGLLIPVDRKHVVGEDFAKLELTRACGLDLFNVDFVRLEVSSMESGCSWLDFGTELPVLLAK